MSLKSNPTSRFQATTSLPGRRKPTSRLAQLGIADRHAPPASMSLRASKAGLTTGPKTQRSSKTTHKLVVLPSAPQTKPFSTDVDDDLTLGHETDGGVREYKSQAERMTKDQRKNAGFKRITAYCVAESFKMKLLSSFLKREHNVSPRVFDEALYVMYHLPLLPGYGPGVNIRSSVAAVTTNGKSFLAHLSEAEENGYQGTYFTSQASRSSTSLREGYISSSSPLDSRHPPQTIPVPTTNLPPDEGPEQYMEPATSVSDSLPTIPTDVEPGAEADPGSYGTWKPADDIQVLPPTRIKEEVVAEVVFFEFGVVVFFGLEERHEKDILEDITSAGILKRPMAEGDWEIEECHFAHDPQIAYPRIYNDFFTLKSRSHLLKLSIAHALAQSTLLARYETNAQRVLSSPLTLSIPKQLAESGALRLRRNEALKLTGRLFKLRLDVNLVSNVLDVPELFWSEASLKNLYDAVREYMEITPRVQVLNEKLGVASDFLEAIHDHLNNSAMERITWIVIWLIVVACLVELGEVLARIIFHEAKGAGKIKAMIPPISQAEALQVLERMMNK
ncbi:DUF155-domain-containing protein [Phlegmacium glaucopus]|nr:DUF155-domain-containing protein [Phlegmacium glaucopus]